MNHKYAFEVHSAAIAAAQPHADQDGLIDSAAARHVMRDAGLEPDALFDAWCAGRVRDHCFPGTFNHQFFRVNRCSGCGEIACDGSCGEPRY